jgi:hypothetical protein
MHTDTLILGDLHFGLAVLEPRDGLDDDVVGACLGIVLMEFNMGGTFDVAAWVGGDQRRIVAVGHLDKSLFDALHIDAHGIHGAGDQIPASVDMKLPAGGERRGGPAPRPRSSTCPPG